MPCLTAPGQAEPLAATIGFGDAAAQESRESDLDLRQISRDQTRKDQSSAGLQRASQGGRVFQQDRSQDIRYDPVVGLALCVDLASEADSGLDPVQSGVEPAMLDGGFVDLDPVDLRSEFGEGDRKEPGAASEIQGANGCPGMEMLDRLQANASRFVRTRSPARSRLKLDRNQRITLTSGIRWTSFRTSMISSASSALST